MHHKMTKEIKEESAFESEKVKTAKMRDSCKKIMKRMLKKNCEVIGLGNNLYFEIG